MGVGEEEGGKLDVSNDFAFAFVDDGQGVNQVVGEHLSDTEASVLLVRGGTEGEGHGGEALVNFSHQGTSGLHLQVVGSIGRALVDGSTGLTFASLSVSSGHDNVDAVNLVNVKLELIDLLISVGLVQNNLRSIDDETLKLMSQDTLDRRALEDLGDLGDGGGDLSVGASRADETVGDLGGVVGGANNISGTASSGLFSASSNDDGSGGLRDETINLDSQIAVLQKKKEGEGNFHFHRFSNVFELADIEQKDVLGKGLLKRGHFRADKRALEEAEERTS